MLTTYSRGVEELGFASNQIVRCPFKIHHTTSGTESATAERRRGSAQPDKRLPACASIDEGSLYLASLKDVSTVNSLFHERVDDDNLVL